LRGSGAGHGLDQKGNVVIDAASLPQGDSAGRAGAATGLGRGTRLEVAAASGRALARPMNWMVSANDVHRRALAAVLRLPLAPAQTAVDRHGAPLCEVARAVLAWVPNTSTLK
jgi:hypothetical protein